MIYRSTEVDGYVVTTIKEEKTFRIEVRRNDDTKILSLKTFVLDDMIEVHHEGVVMLVSIGKLPIYG